MSCWPPPCRKAGKRGVALIRKRDTTRPRQGRHLLGPDGAAFQPYFSSVGAACPAAGYTGAFPSILGGSMGELVWDGRVCANAPPIGSVSEHSCEKWVAGMATAGYVTIVC